MMEFKRLGKYEILEEIGRGGFAVVYKARDTTLDRIVALKVLHTHLAENATFVQRFNQEARTAAKLQHPHIVTIHEVDEDAGWYYLAMALLPGQTLDKRLATAEGPLPLEQTVPIIEQVASALDATHQRGLIHRDVKPTNIIVDDKGQATLLDFGIVRAADGTHLTTAGTMMGTPQYMSPEQAEGDEVDHRSDIYSLGVVAYQICTGRAPFDGVSPVVVLRLHADQSPPTPRKLNPHLPVQVEQVLLKALAKKREERYQSAGELAQALREAMEAAEQARQREEQEPQLRRIDAAAPSHAQVDQTINLLVQVRFPDSPLLGIESWPTKQKPPLLEQVSDSVAIHFPVDRQTGKPGPACLKVCVVAPDFEVKGAAHQPMEVPPDRDSQCVRFLLLARKAGTCRINVEVYRSDRVYLGTIPLEVDTTADRQVTASNILVANLVVLIAVGQEPQYPSSGGSTQMSTEIPANRPLRKGERSKLREILKGRFNEEELQDLCFDLQVDYESLPAKGKAGKARELISYCRRYESVSELVKKGKQLRPDIHWEDIYESPMPARPASVPQPILFRRTILTWIGVFALLIAASVGLALRWESLRHLFTAPLTPTPAATLTPAATPPLPPTPPPDGIWTRPTDGMVMVHVPGGEFPMGRKPNEKYPKDDESPEHIVALDGFWIDRTEVTNAQFAAFLNERRKEAEEVTAWLALENKACLIKQVGDKYEAKSSYAEHPVIEVTWNGAEAYCEWAGARLLTEAEWEYAARGTKGYDYPWGNIFSCSRGNFDDERYVTTVFVLRGDDKCDGNTTTAPVGSFPAGASWCKALDMAGNVSEWVADWYGDYPDSQQTNPTGPLSGTLKVARGGAYYVPTPDLPLAARRYPHPPGNHDRGLGFRCAISQESESR